jgi:hypothetical protein
MGMMPSDRPLRLLFVCTGNSARSQIAQAVLNRKGRGRFLAESAGSQPAARVHPMAIATLESHGIPGQPVLAHWGMPDPAEATGTEAERQRVFDDTLVLIGRRIDLLLALPIDKLEKLVLQQRVNQIGGAGAAPAAAHLA